MATALSEGEFHRMQLQLIDLRTTNYELESKAKKLDRELTEANEKIEGLDKELAKAKQAISKSKKAKDVEVLIQESDSLQRKLMSQEEEFRLQNQTLMTELGMLVSSNEELKKEIENLKSGAGTVKDNSELSAQNDELIRLRAENAALQKNLEALQRSYGKEIESKNERPSPEGDCGLTEESDESREPDKSKDGRDQVDNTVKVSTSPSLDHSDVFKKLRLELDTEREEKHIIKTQLDQREKESKEQVTSLQEELDKATEKYKKKQESYLQLHAEKEQLFKDTSAKLEETQAARDRDQKYFRDQITKLQQEVEKSKKQLDGQKLAAQKEENDLKQQLEELQKQINTSGMVANHQLQEQSGKYMSEINVIKGNLAKVTKERDDLEAQFQESRRAADEAISQMQAAQTERDSQISAVQEVSKVAEKRKSLLDELAIKYQKEYDAHRENIKQIKKEHDEQEEELKSTIEHQEKKIVDLGKQLPAIDELNKKVSSLEDTKGWLERRLTEVEEELSKAIASHEEEKESLVQSQEKEVEELTRAHKEVINKLETERKSAEDEGAEREKMLQDELDKLKNQANELKQEIKDSEDDKKIHEKKGKTMLKDLKRQLHAERKRAEKLQAKLQEVLSEGHNKNMDDLFRSPDSDPQTWESSSLSSWGAAASGLGKDSVASGPQSPMSGNTSHISDNSVGDEYSQVLTRVGALQQEKWALEEKVSHLEMSNACMAEDILNKTSIIEHYVMDSRTGPKQTNVQPHEEKLSLKKVMDMVNKNSDHTQQTQDMNKKLQSMLEETLTKNMHLQQDLELMSQEVVRLSKLSATGSSNPQPPTHKVKEAMPPSSLLLTSTTASPSSGNVSTNDENNSSINDRESSSTSEENFEVITAEQTEIDYDAQPMSESQEMVEPLS